jgi:structural maintenance of chromosome 1
MLRRILFRLYHMEESIETNARTIVLKNKELSELRKEQRKHEKALEAARADQAKAKTGVMQVEKALKRAEKALESKVSPSQTFVHILGTIIIS